MNRNSILKLLFLTMTLVPLPVPAYVCESFKSSEVIGTSGDGKSWVLRMIDYPGDSRNMCRYPKFRGKEILGVSLVLYNHNKAVKKWVIYQMKISGFGEPDPKITCTKSGIAAARLAEAKKYFNKAGINLKEKEIPLSFKTIKVKSGKRYLAGNRVYIIPASVMNKYGINRPVYLKMWFYTETGNDFNSLYTITFSARDFGEWNAAKIPCNSYCFFELINPSLWSNRKLLSYNYKNHCGESVQKVLPLKNIAAELFNYRGLRYHRKKKYEKSIALFKKSIDANNLFARAYFNCACSYSLYGNTDSALDYLEQAIKLDPAGYKPLAKKDMDLKILWKTERFKEIVR